MSILHLKLKIPYLQLQALYSFYILDTIINLKLNLKNDANNFRAFNVKDYILKLLYLLKDILVTCKQYTLFHHNNDIYSMLLYISHIFHRLYGIFRSYLRDINHVFYNEKLELHLNHEAIISYILDTKSL